MTPVNNKSLLHFIFDQMERLSKNEIDVQTAKAQGVLAKQANNTMKYELDMVNTLIKLDDHNRSNGTDIQMRNIEGKSFD
jgi:hypothetical protein